MLKEETKICKMPANADNEISMQKDGYFFADRTLQASINLSRFTVDTKKLIRLNIVSTKEHKEEIFEVARTRVQNLLSSPNSLH